MTPAKVLHFPAPELLLDRVPGPDELGRLRRAVQAGDEINPQSEPMQRMVQRLAAGAVEVVLISRLTMMHRLWPDPTGAFAHRELCRQITGLADREIRRAAEMLGAAITAAVNEAALMLDDDGFDVDEWCYVLTEILTDRELPIADNVVDFSVVLASKIIAGLD